MAGQVRPRRSQRRGAQAKRPTADETYARIIDRSIDLIQRQGFRATSLAEISAAVGIQKASLYYHIGSKDDLLEAVYEDVIAELIQASIARHDPAAPSCEQLGAVVYNHIRFHVRNRPFMRIFWRERHELPRKVFERVRERERQYELFVSQIITAGKKTGCIAANVEPAVLRNGILGLLTTIYRWPHPVIEVEGDDYVDALSAEIWRLVGVSLGFDRCGHGITVADLREAADRPSAPDQDKEGD